MANLIEREMTARSNGVDVGAHQGSFLQHIVSAAPKGTHFAVEPIPDLAAELRRRFPNVEVHQCALSDSEGEATFYVTPERPAWSGLRRQDFLGQLETKEVLIALKQLDQIVGDTPVRFIKIDVEGAELGVLNGARKVIARDRPTLVLEHARIHARNYGTEPKEVWDYFDGLDYALAPVAIATQTLNCTDFVALCDASDASGYDRHAVTNWIASPN